MANNTLELIIKAQDYATKELKNIEKQLKGIWDTAKKAWDNIKDFWTRNADTFKKIWIGAGIAVTAVWYVWKQFLDLSTQVQQTQKKASIVFWEFIWDVQKVASETAKWMWLSQTEFLNAAAWIQDLLIPMWFARSEATWMTTDLLWLSGALSEWSAWQYTASQVWDILAKAMLWEREQLKWLGIAISEEDVKQQLLKNWTAELTGVQLQQAKATATQQLIFEKSTDAQEAYRTGWESLTRQQAILTATIKDAKDAIAIALIPAFNELLIAMTPVIADIAKSIELWTSNKQNIDWVTNSMMWAIEVFKTIWVMIQFIITLLWYLLLPFQDAFNKIALLAANIVIFFENMTGSLNSFEWTAKVVTENISAFFKWMFDWIMLYVDKAISALNRLKALWWTISTAYWNISSNVKTVLWLDWTRATWWPVSANWTYLVWEKWPELFTPKSWWNITPNNQLGGWWININMWGVVVNNEADENRLVEKIKQSLTNSLQMNKFGIS